MSLVINTHTMAFNVACTLSDSCKQLSSSIRRLATGLSASSTADASAGLSVPDLMRADVAVFTHGTRSAEEDVAAMWSEAMAQDPSLESSVAHLKIQAENLSAAQSRISDADVAVEMMQFVRAQLMARRGKYTVIPPSSMPRMALALAG